MRRVYRDSRNAVWRRRGREECGVSQRITFQEELAAETQEGRRSMVCRSSSTYNGGVSASSGASEDQRARETKEYARVRDRDEVSSSR